MGLPVRDTHYHTYGEYLTWPEDARHELIDGVAYAMAPAPVRIHQGLVGELFRQIAEAISSTAVPAVTIDWARVVTGLPDNVAQ